MYNDIHAMCSKGNVFRRILCLCFWGNICSFEFQLLSRQMSIYVVYVTYFLHSLPPSLSRYMLIHFAYVTCNKSISKYMQIVAGDTKEMILFAEFICVCRLAAMQYMNETFELS